MSRDVDNRCQWGAKYGWYHTWEIDGTESAKKCEKKLEAQTGLLFYTTCQTYEDCLYAGADVTCHSNKTICTVDLNWDVYAYKITRPVKEFFRNFTNLFGNV